MLNGISQDGQPRSNYPSAARFLALFNLGAPWEEPVLAALLASVSWPPAIQPPGDTRECLSAWEEQFPGILPCELWVVAERLRAKPKAVTESVHRAIHHGTELHKLEHFKVQTHPKHGFPTIISSDPNDPIRYREMWLKTNSLK